MDIALKTKSWSPVVRDGWIIKFSIYKDTFILISMLSEYTGQYIVRQFSREDEAVIFINFILELDPTETYEL